MFIKALIYTFTFLFFVHLQGQAYEPDPCEGSGNQELKMVLKGEVMDYLYLHGCGPGWSDAIATSFLKASGKPPTEPSREERRDEFDEIWEDYYMAYDQWTCSYAPSNLTDGNSATAWVEGVKGHGIGEIVLAAEVDVFKPIQIWNGYGKSANLHIYNSRVKRANVHVLRGRLEGATQCGSVFTEIKLVTSHEVSLRDLSGYQDLSIPEFSKETYEFQEEQWDYRYWLALEILEVYPGTKWQDTCISEISN